MIILTHNKYAALGFQVCCMKQYLPRVAVSSSADEESESGLWHLVKVSTRDVVFIFFRLLGVGFGVEVNSGSILILIPEAVELDASK